MASGINNLGDSQGSCWTAYYADRSLNKKDKIGYLCFDLSSINNECVDGLFDTGKLQAKTWGIIGCYHPDIQEYIIPHFECEEKSTYLFELKFDSNNKRRLIGHFYNRPFMSKVRAYNCIVIKGRIE